MRRPRPAAPEAERKGRMVYTCPYCNVSCSDLNAKVVRFYESPEKSGMWDVMLDTGSAIYDSVFLEFCTCPECHKTSVHLESICSARRDFKFSFTFPSISAACFPDYVPVAIQQDYDEAIAVLDASPKAAATLARRCLQGMIHDFWQIHEKNLNAEITALKGNVPADQWAAIDAVRKIGNIGAHMEQDVNLIIDVSRDEAKSLIRLIELLVQDWYVARSDREMVYKSVIEAAERKDMDRRPLKRAEGKRLLH